MIIMELLQYIFAEYQRTTKLQPIFMKYVHIIFLWKDEHRASMHHSDNSFIFHTLRHVDMPSLRYSIVGIAIMYI